MQGVWGINCNIKNSYINKHNNRVYCLIFYTNLRLFNLPRKYNKQKITKNRYRKTGIYDIKYIGKKLCKCVTVDALDHSYLIGDYITTHNCTGAIEIYTMPQKDSKGDVPMNRYISSTDPYDSDQSETMSLGSFFILDLWTDKLVAEYTGRPDFADDFYEKTRRLCLFYNAKNCYENNLKGLFSYYSKKNSVYLLAETPQFLKDRQLIGGDTTGNSAYGVRATPPIINYGFRLIKEWLLKPTIRIEKDENGNEHEVEVPNLYNIRNRALLKELVLWNPAGNFDRIMSLLQLMLYREEKMIIYQGDVVHGGETQSGMESDPYWQKNYPGKPSERM